MDPFHDAYFVINELGPEYISMNEDEKRPHISLKLDIGPFEISVTNYSKDELQSALKASLDAFESNSEKISALVEKYTATRIAEKGCCRPSPEQASRLYRPFVH